MDLDTYIDKKLQEFLEGRDKLSEDDLKRIFDDIVKVFSKVYKMLFSPIFRCIHDVFQ